MKSIRIVSLSLLLMAVALAQNQDTKDENTIPAGTVIPIMLSSTIDAARNKPSDQIVGKVMQQVPLPSGSRIPAGARVLGRVVDVNRASGSTA